MKNLFIVLIGVVMLASVVSASTVYVAEDKDPLDIIEVAGNWRPEIRNVTPEGVFIVMFYNPGTRYPIKQVRVFALPDGSILMYEYFRSGKLYSYVDLNEAGEVDGISEPRVFTMPELKKCYECHKQEMKGHTFK